MYNVKFLSFHLNLYGFQYDALFHSDSIEHGIQIFQPFLSLCYSKFRNFILYQHFLDIKQVYYNSILQLSTRHKIHNMIQQILLIPTVYQLQKIQDMQLLILQLAIMLQSKLDNELNVFLILNDLHDLRIQHLDCKDFEQDFHMEEDKDQGWGDLHQNNLNQVNFVECKVERLDWRSCFDWGLYIYLDQHYWDSCKDCCFEESEVDNHQNYMDLDKFDCLNDCFDCQKKVPASDGLFNQQILQDIKKRFGRNS